MKTDEAFVLAVDPGREKCGVAVLSVRTGTAVFHRTVSTEELFAATAALQQKYAVNIFAVGSGTTGKKVCAELERLFPAAAVKSVDEYRTTDDARKRYWEENPPRGIKRLIPKGLLVPPVPVDDFAAVIIGEKYLAGARHCP